MWLIIQHAHKYKGSEIKQVFAILFPEKDLIQMEIPINVQYFSESNYNQIWGVGVSYDIIYWTFSKQIYILRH